MFIWEKEVNKCQYFSCWNKKDHGKACETIAKYDNCETNLSYSTRHDVATTTNIETYPMYYFHENLDLDACISYIIYVCIIRICLIYIC